MLDDVFARHEIAALFFSGGKDSLVLLELAKPYWDRTAVVWVDTGASLPEIHELMDRIKATVPNFFVVKTDQPAQIAEFGYPVDTLPIWRTAFGQASGGPVGVRLQSWADCCNTNLWQPAWEYAKSLGVTAVIRGQRSEDHIKAPTVSGQVFDGIELVYPLQDWTEDDVQKFLADAGYTDERLQLGHSSLDCADCTAYLGHTNDRLAYLRKHHPDKARHVYGKLKEIRVVLQQELDTLTNTLTEAIDG